MRRVVAYLRPLAATASLASQRAAVEAAAQAEGWELVETVTEGPLDDTRPELERAVGLVRSGADALVVTSIDRLILPLSTTSRPLADLAALAERVELVALDDDLDTATVSGRAAARLLASLASLEAKASTMRPKKAVGARPVGGRSLGRRRGPVDVEMVRQVLEEEGSLNAAALALNRKGVPPPSGSSRWQARSVYGVLETPDQQP
ncbi:MAG: recombinase family protein [Acidimicrobiia bacterium]